MLFSGLAVRALLRLMTLREAGRLKVLLLPILMESKQKNPQPV
jgi:hypothetical protein